VYTVYCKCPYTWHLQASRLQIVKYSAKSCCSVHI